MQKCEPPEGVVFFSEHTPTSVFSVLRYGPMRSDMVSKLPYLSAVIRETLRLYPTAPGFTLQPKSQNPEDFPVFIGKEQYVIRRGESISVSIPTLHRETTVYGEDAEHFNPARFLNEDGSLKPPVPDTKDEGHTTFGFGRRCETGTFELTQA